MKSYQFLFVMIVCVFLVISRELKAQSAQDKIESARIALITERLNLSPEEAQKFWPLYNEYSQERRALQQEYLKAREQFRAGKMTEEQSEKLLEIGLKLKERELQLDRKYTERMNTVISNRQLIALRQAEIDFRKILLERLKERRDSQERFQNRQERRFRDN